MTWNSSERTPVLRTANLTKELPLGAEIVRILRGISLEIYRGERVGIIGPSGSGKTTLLGLMGGLDKPTSGTIELDGIDISRLSESRLAEVRNEKIGFVFQFFNLVPTLTALENVMLPIEFARKPKFNPRRRAAELLELLGLKDRMHHRPSQLSGGQQQRVAIARALANNPPLVLADEPTGNLDTEAGKLVLKALMDVQRETGTTIVVVTHDARIANQMERVLTLLDGQLVAQAEAVV
ncbi:MAG: ABC transporter ATP-binding protein [Candidatus Thermofonsia Clade 1 bacterium]|uniref:ABC transporter ATP-binding protein n=1 Tax=Candidatus Thermofonsia Clade 1 bacterium TaxID=2364210 RepID=A0A2M8PIH9_9CHLR|nr:MAG: ABC transporter ATP-binding protein [Candidatus Thermofonsia Clade 1 bacterium]RMF53965.1 MAG: ABC transporter ATP-binding protein [Chloroflexota bacterium]